MRERSDILKTWKRVEAAGETAVLATVVKTQGSSYRLPGARLLVTQSGEHVGGVSGGCLEDEILKKAWWLTANGPVVRRYDTTPDDELATGGYGLGCNGIVHVLLERVTGGSPSVLSLFEEVERLRSPAYAAHVLSPAGEVGQRLMVDGEGRTTCSLRDAATADMVRAAIDEGLDGLQSFGPNRGTEIFIERIEPPVRLLIFGAGADAVPVSEFAARLGWKVEIADGRSHYARPEKFPTANSVSLRPLETPAPPVDEWTAAVVMTHSFTQDTDILRCLFDTPLFYLGVLGPRKRTNQLLEEAGLLTQKTPQRLHSPMGLDIGADGPEQVALAVIAEIQSVNKGRKAGLLRDRSGSIHGLDTGDGEGEKQAWPRSIICA